MTFESEVKLAGHSESKICSFRDLYRSARSCNWGDLLPARQIPATDKKSSKSSGGIDDVGQLKEEEAHDLEDDASIDMPSVLTHNDSWSSVVNHTYRDEPLEKYDSEEIGTFKPVV
jgi:hypothetical protein